MLTFARRDFVHPIKIAPLVSTYFMDRVWSGGFVTVNYFIFKDMLDLLDTLQEHLFFSGSPSPIPVSTTTPTALARPTPLQAWVARQAKTQPPIIMQSVKSTQVQKPVLQTAVAPTSPQIPASPTSTTPPATTVPPPSYTASIQQKQQQCHVSKPAASLPSNGCASPTVSSSTLSVPTTEPPSYASTMQVCIKTTSIINSIWHN